MGDSPHPTHTFSSPFPPGLEPASSAQGDQGPCDSGGGGDPAWFFLLLSPMPEWSALSLKRGGPRVLREHVATPVSSVLNSVWEVTATLKRIGFCHETRRGGFLTSKFCWGSDDSQGCAPLPHPAIISSSGKVGNPEVMLVSCTVGQGGLDDGTPNGNAPLNQNALSTHT